MFLSKIILENFQAFEKGEFDLSPNLNILVGVSNVGKSSVSRALALVLFNKWDKSWVRFGTKYCRVTIETSTGIQVIREKGDKINRYILTLPGQAGQTYESFGVGVPEPIQQALRIHEVQIDATDTLNLNLAGQMDALFLLSQTGSYRAKVLGKLSGATYLDFAIRELNKDKRQTTAEKSTKELELTELQTQVDKLAPIEAFTSQLVEIETKLTALGAQEARLQRICSLFERVKVLKDAWAKETAIEALIGQIDTSIINELALKVDKIKAISLLSSRMDQILLSQTKQNKLQELLAQVDLSTIPVLSGKNIRIKQISDLFKKVTLNEKELASKTDELEQVERKYQETSKQYSDMLRENKVCPICNQTVENLNFLGV